MKKTIYIICLVMLTSLYSCGNKGVKVEVTNDSSIDRENEMVEISIEEVRKDLSIEDCTSLVILDKESKQIPYQALYKGEESVQSIIFPATVKAGEKISVTFTTGTPDNFEPMVIGQFVPERKDDFAWENDKNAFRMYGPALEATGEISNGIDIWTKRTTKLVQRKWYEDDLAGKASYHRDNGEGLDFYKVGRTLGMGAAAPYTEGKLWLGNNFISYDILDNGPLRVTFKLSYAPYMVEEKLVDETRTISLDAYSYFNKITETYSVEKPMHVASGIVHRNENEKITDFSIENGYMVYEEPMVKNSGIIYVGVISPYSFNEVKIEDEHLLGISEYTPGKEFSYYTGGGWSKAEFTSMEEWKSCVENFSKTIRQPLKVNISK